MASRTSTVVAKGKGALIYHNTSTGAQLVTINAAAQDGVSNPKIGVLLDSSATNALNTEINKYSLSGTLPMALDLAVLSSGVSANVLTSGQNGSSYLADASGSNLVSSASNSASFQFVDPWFWHKPSEYGNKSDTDGHFVGRSSNDGYVATWNSAVSDVKAGTYSKQSLLDGSNSSYTNQKSQSYYNRGFCFDQYTLSFVSVNSNGYMSGGSARPGDTNWTDVNQSNGSPVYQVNMAQYGSDPWSYPSNGNSNVKQSPAMIGEGGVFVHNYLNPSNQGQARVHLSVVGRGHHGGVLPTDHSSTVSSSFSTNPNIGTLLSTSADCTGWFYTDPGSFQWMKYNKANDKYYYCFKNSNANNAGVFEMEYKDHASSSNSNIGQEGNGPYNATPHQHSGIKKVGSYPISANDAHISIPAKVGDNLWLMYELSNSTAYFSENLIDWTPASTYIDGGYLIKNQNTGGVDHFLKSNGQVITVSTGLAEMDQAGLLEKSTPIGNYTRNGLVLNPGDCLYADNERTSTTSVSFTVTEVAI